MKAEPESPQPRCCWEGCWAPQHLAVGGILLLLLLGRAELSRSTSHRPAAPQQLPRPAAPSAFHTLSPSLRWWLVPEQRHLHTHACSQGQFFLAL